MAEHHDVIIAGAGLAGLAAARELAIHQVDVLVLEAGDTVGGRVRTDRVDGLQLDRGFQLMNPSYPEVQRVLDLDALDLRALAAGVIVALNDTRARLADPRRLPRWSADALASGTGSLVAKSRFARYAWHAARTPVPDLLAGPDFSAQVALRSAGVDDALYERVLRPFLAGVFLESELATSRRFLDLVLRSFVRGTPAVPARGMQAIPEQLHEALPPGTVRLKTAVAAVSGSTVTTPGCDFTARAVLVATDPQTATGLLPGLRTPPGNGVTTWYHLAPGPAQAITEGRGVLVVDGLQRGPVINSVAISHAAPEYASGERTLISSSVLGGGDSSEDERAVRTHLATLYGMPTTAWEFVRAYRIPYALPSMRPPLDVRKPVELGDGLFIAGDHRDTASIQGAMVSGRRAADAILEHLGITPIN